MAIDDNTSYELTGRQVKDLANKVKAKADTASLASVATSGLYSDLTGAPTIPTVYNGTLTIQQNGTDVETFTANQSTNVTANISVPTQFSDLSGSVTSSQIDWSSCSGTVTGPDGNVWNWTYLLDGRKMYYRQHVFNIPSGGTSATSWRNSSNFLTMPAGLTRTTALVIASMNFHGNGEVTTTPIWRGSSNNLSCGSFNYYDSGAYNVDGNVIVIPLS